MTETEKEHFFFSLLIDIRKSFLPLAPLTSLPAAGPPHYP